MRLLVSGAVTLRGNWPTTVWWRAGDLVFEGEGTSTLVVCSEAAAAVVSEDGRTITGPDGQTWQLDGVEVIHFLDAERRLDAD